VASISTNQAGLRRILFTGADKKRKALKMGRAPMATCRTVRDHIQAIVVAQCNPVSIPRETAAWLGDLDAFLYCKLVTLGLTKPRIEPSTKLLGPWVNEYITLRADVKGSTALVYGHVKRCLLEYFKANKPLAAITRGDADAWRIWLATNEN